MKIRLNGSLAKRQLNARLKRRGKIWRKNNAAWNVGLNEPKKLVTLYKTADREAFFGASRDEGISEIDFTALCSFKFKRMQLHGK